MHIALIFCIKSRKINEYDVFSTKNLYIIFLNRIGFFRKKNIKFIERIHYYFTFGNTVKYKNETRLRLVFIFV